MKNLIEVAGNNSIIPSPYALAIPEFSKLTVKELAYIYFLCDHRSPYAYYELDERKRALSKEFEIIATPKLRTAIDKYNELTETHAVGLLKAARESVQKLKKYFEEIDLTVTDDNGKLLYTAKDLIGNLKQIGEVVDGLNALEDLVKKEQSKSSVNRGGVENSKYNT